MRPMTLIAVPVILFMILGLIANNALAWFIACGQNLACNPPLTLISSNSPFFALMNGDFTSFLSTLAAPNMTGIGTIIAVIAGAILLIFSFVGTISLTVLGSGFVFGMTDQGSKVAQSVGIGLLVWSFAISLEGGWIISVAFGLGNLLLLFLQIITIMAIWWQSQTTL
jgi:hypothetical protein